MKKTDTYAGGTDRRYKCKLMVANLQVAAKFFNLARNFRRLTCHGLINFAFFSRLMKIAFFCNHWTIILRFLQPFDENSIFVDSLKEVESFFATLKILAFLLQLLKEIRIISPLYRVFS